MSAVAQTEAARLSAAEAFSNLKFRFTVDNQPNPEILLPSLRTSGYTLESAIGDLVDNSLDAEATTVAVSMAKEEDGFWTIEVADDGFGMDSHALDQMMRLGSRVEHDISSQLGRFGLGSTTASLALGTVQHVITADASGNFTSAATDLDEVVRRRAFLKHLGPATPVEEQLFREAFSRHGLQSPALGTLVRVLRCDKIGRHSLKPAVDSVRRYLGEVYRYFIDAGKTFYVNGDRVDAVDPLDRKNPDTVVLLDDSFDYLVTRDGEKTPETVGVILVQLPDWGGQEANRSHGVTIERSGLYVLRNRRQIAQALTFGIFARHNALSRFRGELLFPASIDVDLGVTFLKSSWELKPSQSLRDKVEQIVSPYQRQARRLYYKSLPTSSEEIPHDEAAKLITQRAPFLRKPKAARTSRTLAIRPDSVRRQKPDGQTPPPQSLKPQTSLAEIARFEARDLGSTAPIYEADLVGRRVVITYNSAHPFYQRFILENRDNRSVITAIDYLVYSLAAAELMVSDESTYRFIERMREDMSFNMRQLLST
jgi:hypothetical protein